MNGAQRERGKVTLAISIAFSLTAAIGVVLVDTDAAGQSSPVTPLPPQAVAGSPQSFPPPLVEGPQPDLGLAFTAQVVGWVEPCG